MDTSDVPIWPRTGIEQDELLWVIVAKSWTGRVIGQIG